MTNVTNTEANAIDGGNAHCAGVYIQLGDFALCIGQMTP